MIILVTAVVNGELAAKVRTDKALRGFRQTITQNWRTITKIDHLTHFFQFFSYERGTQTQIGE